MPFELRSTNDLVRIASAGGGFRLDATVRSIEDLVRIAAAASGHGTGLYFRGLGIRATDDLVRIGAAGKGAVVFED